MKKIVTEIYVQDVDSNFLAGHIKDLYLNEIEHKGNYHPYTCAITVEDVNEEQATAIKRDYYRKINV